jgi:hypothetical protein
MNSSSSASNTPQRECYTRNGLLRYDLPYNLRDVHWPK